MASKWNSRKLFAALGGVVVVVLTNVGMPEEAAARVTEAVMWILTMFVGGQSVVDAAGAIKKRDPDPGK